MKKIFVIFGILIVFAIISTIIYIGTSSDSMGFEKVRLEVNGEQVKPLIISHCYGGYLRSYCVDTSHPDKFDFGNATIELEGDSEVKVVAPWYFVEKSIFIEDLNGGIFSFELNTRKGSIPFVIYVK